MKSVLLKGIVAVAVGLFCAGEAQAQFNLKKAVGAAASTVKAVTLTDAQMT